MTVAETRNRLSAALQELAWAQWAALGVSSPRRPLGPIDLDLEALLLLTLEVGRDDSRLFDEALDWCHRNADLISTQRLANLCADETDQALVDAMLAWLGAQGRGARRARLGPPPAHAPLQPLFPAVGETVATPDASFAAFGFARPALVPSNKSVPPDLLRPECLTLRLRTLLGSGAKPEVVSLLLTLDAPHVELAVVQASSGFSAKRTLDAVRDLSAAGQVQRFTVGGTTRLMIDRAAWAAFLGTSPKALPLHRDWPQLSASFRLLVRWLRTSDSYASPYLRASAARSLWGEIEPRLRFAGVHIPRRPFASGEEYWDEFVTALEPLTQHAEAMAGGR